MKPWYTSRTIWLNLLAGTVGALIETVPTVRDYLPQGWYGIYAVGLAIVNVWLRIITTQPIVSGQPK